MGVISEDRGEEARYIPADKGDGKIYRWTRGTGIYTGGQGGREDIPADKGGGKIYRWTKGTGRYTGGQGEERGGGGGGVITADKGGREEEGEF